MNKKILQKIIISFLIVFIFTLIYLIGFHFVGGKITKVNLNEVQKQQIMEKYGLIHCSIDNFISFQQVSYNRKYANVLILRKNEVVEEIIDSNPHIQKKEKLKAFGLPYPNVRYIPYKTKECCCFFDKNYYYLSVFSQGSDYNKEINTFFWNIHNNQ